MSYQKIIVSGNLGGDAELKHVKGDKELLKFRVAQSDRFTQQTNWFQVEYWRGGKIADYLTKGTQVIVEGRVRLEQWDGKDGRPGAALVITADDVRLIGGRGGERQSEGGARLQSGVAVGGAPDDEIPF